MNEKWVARAKVENKKIQINFRTQIAILCAIIILIKNIKVGWLDVVEENSKTFNIRVGEQEQEKWEMEKVFWRAEIQLDSSETFRCQMD